MLIAGSGSDARCHAPRTVLDGGSNAGMIPSD
jgi:hypothetical protein